MEENETIDLERQLGMDMGISIATETPIVEQLLSEQSNAKYSVIGINVKTLFRNFYQSYDKTVFDSKPMAEILKEFMQDVDTVHSRLHGLDIFFYETDWAYQNPKSFLGLAKVKEPKTKLQKEYARLETSALSYFKKNKLSDYTFKKYTNLITYGKALPCMLLTHNTLDLISRKNFSELFLLESNTGKLKPREQWNTKLTNSPIHLPFNIFTLCSLGDHATNFYTLPKKYTTAIHELATRAKWTPFTTLDKIKFDVEEKLKGEERAYLKQLSRIQLK